MAPRRANVRDRGLNLALREIETMATLTRKRLRSPAERSRIERESLDRATRNLSLANYPAIFEGFAALGIPENQVSPREERLHLSRMASFGPAGPPRRAWRQDLHLDRNYPEGTRSGNGR